MDLQAEVVCSEDEVEIVMGLSAIESRKTELSNAGNEMYAGRISDCFDCVMLGFGVGNVRGHQHDDKCGRTVRFFICTCWLISRNISRCT